MNKGCKSIYRKSLFKAKDKGLGLCKFEESDFEVFGGFGNSIF